MENFDITSVSSFRHAKCKNYLVRKPGTKICKEGVTGQEAYYMSVRKDCDVHRLMLIPWDIEDARNVEQLHRKAVGAYKQQAHS